MFGKSKADITFEDVETFCEYHAEGVHVEYKRQIPKDISKVISSFANTYGGICLIGVEANQVDNRVSSISGIPKERGIEEQILQRALMGIYPSVIPEVILIDVPSTENVVVVIRVDESIHAPHAIDKATKVYFRVGSVSQPYKLQLADIDHITYMLKRREGAEQVSEQVLTQFKGITKYRYDINEVDMSMPILSRMTVSISPTFTNRLLMSPAEIYDTFSNNTIKKVSGGVVWEANNKTRYTLINEHGIVHHSDCIHFADQKVEYQSISGSLIPPLKQAGRLYESCGYLGSIEVNVDIKHVRDTKLALPESIFSRHLLESARCLEDDIVIDTQCFATDLTNKDSCITIFMELSRQLFWAYDLPDNVNTSQKFLALIQSWYLQL